MTTQQQDPMLTQPADSSSTTTHGNTSSLLLGPAPLPTESAPLESEVGGFGSCEPACYGAPQLINIYTVRPQLPTGTVLTTIPIHPDTFPDNIKYFVNGYQYWTGGVTYVFSVQCNSLSRGELRVVFVPAEFDPSTITFADTYGMFYTDVPPNTPDLTLTVPDINPTNFRYNRPLDTTNTSNFLGHLVVMVKVPFTAQTELSSQIWMSLSMMLAPSFEVKHPNPSLAHKGKTIRPFQGSQIATISPASRTPTATNSDSVVVAAPNSIRDISQQVPLINGPQYDNWLGSSLTHLTIHNYPGTKFSHCDRINVITGIFLHDRPSGHPYARQDQHKCELINGKTGFNMSLTGKAIFGVDDILRRTDVEINLNSMFANVTNINTDEAWALSAFEAPVIWNRYEAVQSDISVDAPLGESIISFNYGTSVHNVGRLNTMGLVGQIKAGTFNQIPDGKDVWGRAKSRDNAQTQFVFRLNPTGFLSTKPVNTLTQFTLADLVFEYAGVIGHSNPLPSL